MARKKHYVIYVPGIRDDQLYVQSLLIQCWRLQGVRPVMCAMPWFGKEPFDPKLARLVAAIDTYKRHGHEVSLVGTSAGASAVLQAYAQRKDAIQSMALICGKINRPDTVSRRLYARNPAFETSMERLQNVLRQLCKSDKRKIHSFYSPADTTVPHADTVIEGVEEYRLPALRHMWAILYTLSFGSRKLIRTLKK